MLGNDVPLVLGDDVQEDAGSRTERKKLMRTFSERNRKRNVLCDSHFKFHANHNASRSDGLARAKDNPGPSRAEGLTQTLTLEVNTVHVSQYPQLKQLSLIHI